MKKIDFRSQVLPHLVALLVFLVITIGYFNPVFFKNQDIIQHDIQQWKGGAKELLDYRAQTGEEGLWTNSMFSGMPGYLISVQWSDSIVEGIHRIYTIGLPHPVRMVFAAFLSFYVLGLAFRLKPYVALTMSILFGLSSFIIIGIAAGHNARIGAIAYMPLVIAGVHLTFNGKKWLGFGLTATALSLHLRVNHLQITYYLLLILVIYGIIMLISSVRNGALSMFINRIALLVLAAVIAVASFFGEFWSTYEYSKYSMRGKSELTPASTDSGVDGLAKSYAFEYSNSIFEPLVLFIPNVFGGASSNYLAADPQSNTYRALQRSGDQQTANQLVRFSRSYFGKQSNTAPYYAGALTLLLFILGLQFAERKYKLWLVSVFALGIVLSWGNNFSSFNYLMFDYFPAYNKFRAVTFTIILSIFSAALLGGLGLNRLLTEGLSRSNKRKLFIALSISAGLPLFLLLFAGLLDLKAPVDAQLPAWFSGALQQDREGIVRADALRSLIYTLAGFVVIWLLLQKKVNEVIAASLLIIVVTIDSWSVDQRYLNKENFARSPNRAFFAETEADKFIKEDTNLSYRVYNLSAPFNDARTSYHHKSIGGYHGAKMRRYQDLYDHALQPQTQEMINRIRSGVNDLSDLGVINMLNAKYFLAGNSRNAVLRNYSAFGNAWFVGEILNVNNPDEELDTLLSTDLRSTAVVDQSKFDVGNIAADSTASISLTSYAPNRLTYESQAGKTGFALFSEIYYPIGWHATIDDKPVDIIRANYVLRALEVPAGKHSIVFTFEPDSYYLGNKITLVGNLLILLVLLGTLGFEIRYYFMTPKGVNGEGSPLVK